MYGLHLTAAAAEQHSAEFYTVFRKKHPLTFLIITPEFLGRFL